MNLREIYKESTPKRVRQFALLQLPFCILVGIWLWQVGVSSYWLITLFTVSLLLAVIGWKAPQWIRPLYLAWMTAVFPIGFVVSHLIMAIVFFLVVTPIGLWRRATAGDPLKRSFDSQAETYWEPLSPPQSKEEYFRQF